MVRTMSSAISTFAPLMIEWNERFWFKTFERENSNAKVYIIQMGEMLVFKSSCARAFLIITWVPWPWETRSSLVHLIPFRITFQDSACLDSSNFMCCVNFSNFWNFIKIGPNLKSIVQMRNGVPFTRNAVNKLGMHKIQSWVSIFIKHFNFSSVFFRFKRNFNKSKLNHFSKPIRN